MKFLTMTIFAMMSFFALAEDKPFFENMKAMKLANIEKRITYINELKSCVTAAADKDAFKNCNEKHNSDMKALHSDRKEMKEQFKKERKERKEIKKSS